TDTGTDNDNSDTSNDSDNSTDNNKDKDKDDDAKAENRPATDRSQGKYDPLREAAFLMNAKQYNQSLDTLNKVLAVNGNNPQARYLRAVVHVMLRQYGEAATDYQQVIKLSPGTELGKRAVEGLKRIK